MVKSDFPQQNEIFGRSTYLNRELLAFVEHAEKHPQTAAQLANLWGQYDSIVSAALTAAQTRDEMSGPGGGPLPEPPAPDPEPGPEA